MINYFLDKLDIVVYIVIVVIIYMSLLYLWRKLAQLETSFHKLESAFANMVINEDKKIVSKELDSNQVFMEVFEPVDKKDNLKTSGPVIIEDITTEDNISESLSVSSTFTKSKLAKMNVEQLRLQAEKMGEDKEGTKPDLINRILTAQVVEKI